MARARSPNRDKAKQIWLESGGKKLLKDIAADLGIGETQVRKWKSIDKWEDELKGNVTNESEITKGNVTKRKGAPLGNKNAVGNRGGGAPKGNQNAKGNRGGLGGPLRNDKAVTHGLFRKYLPQNEEYLKIFDAAGETHPLDMLWSQIQIKFANIIHAQRIMFVESKDEMIKELKREKSGYSKTGSSTEEEWELQFAWDRQATALNSLSRAMSSLTSMIRQYEELSRTYGDDEERRLKLEQMRLDIEKSKLELGNLRGDDENDAHNQASSYEQALNAQAVDVFADEVDEHAEA